jgi:vanillate O-demethylase monooxygenase subunit
MFLRNAWYVAAAGDEITDRPLARTILNEPVVLFRNGNGAICALEDRCCHRGAPLSLGEVTADGLRCGYHGMEFNSRGICIDIPGNRGRIPDRAKVASYPVFEKTDYVWIWMGDAAKADPATIIEYPPEDQANWPRAHDMLHLKAGYLMVIENLMDLTHLSYLHKNSIGSSPEDSANAAMEVTETPTGVRFLRVMRDAAAPAGWIERYRYKGNLDRWSDFEYVVPSFVVQYTGAVNAGEYDAGIREGGQHVRVLHAVTPETETSCFYFFNRADGYRKFEKPGTPMRGPSITEVFKEDAFMLEQQQLRLNGYDTDRLVNIPSDAARVRMVRALQERLREEQAAASLHPAE